MTIFHNMSAPPRSEVHFKTEQLVDYIAFNPLIICDLLEGKTPYKQLPKRVEYYVKHHPEIEKLLEKPTGYMIGETFEISERGFLTNPVMEKLNNYYFEECQDINLLIVVLCSTVGDLYIPNRPLSFESSKFDKIILFPKVEVNS